MGDFRGHKRHRRNDGSHMRPMMGGRGGGRGGGPTPNQELMEMREAIIHCNGSPEMLRNLAGLLAHDLPSLTEPALKFIMECVTELPVKTPVYAALVGLLNVRVPEFVEEVVRAAIEQLEQKLGSSDPDDKTRARLLLRFIACLPSVGVISAEHALECLDAIVCGAVAAADDANPGWQPRADFLVYIVLAAMPWAGESLSAHAETGNAAEIFDVLLSSVEEYLGRRSRGPDPASMTFAAADGRADDWLEELWGRVNEVRKAGAVAIEAWQVKSVPAVVEPFAEEIAAGSVNSHTPPPIAVPKMTFTGAAEALAMFPVRPRLRALAQAQTEGLWEAGDWGPLERYVAEEYIADTLWAFEPGFRRGAVIPAAEQLGTLPLPSDHPERCQFLVAETLFGEMLALPRPAHPCAFYHIVIQDLCKAIQSFPRMMAKVVGKMFSEIGRMDLEARERLADWMAHHLSCFDLAWPWRSWLHVAEQPSEHPQRAFCASVVRRLLRLVYHERVKESLPEELHCLLPGAPSLNLDYIHDAQNASSGALNDLRNFMKLKTPAEEVMTWFETSGKLEALGNEEAARALTVAAISHGQKCITHHNVLLKRYEPALKKLTEDGDATHVLVGAAAGIWSGTHPRMAVVAVSRLLELGLCTPHSIARWVESTIENENASAATAWGSADAFDIACLAVESSAADRENTAWSLSSLEKKMKHAEADAASAANQASKAAEMGVSGEARMQRAQAKEANAVSTIEETQKAIDEVKESIASAEAAVADAAGGFCLALVKALAPRVVDAAAAAREPIAEAGKEAAAESKEKRALALCVAMLRRFRAQIGDVYEKEILSALNGFADDARVVLGEALSGHIQGA